METIHYLSQFNLLQSLALEDLMEMEELTRITIPIECGWEAVYFGYSE